MAADDSVDLVFDVQEKQVFRTPEFEGPLDLLLYQIQKSEINIYDIPIAEITSQFLQYIEDHKDSGLKNLADFYRMAADLLYIKSRMLLPVDVEFDEEYEDPRQELVDRLIEYQKFKRYTDLLTGSAVGDSFHIPRKENFFALPFQDEDLFRDISIDDLFETFRRIIEKKAPTKLFNVFQEVTVKEKRAYMMELFEKKDQVTISEVIVHFDQPLHIICSFMAILEMAKDKVILFQQKEPNGEIYIVLRPQDWNPSLADEYDKDYDEVVENDLDDPDDFSIISDERRRQIDQELGYEDGEDEDHEEFIGDEEDLMDED